MIEKSLDVTSVEDATRKVSDIKVVGNGNMFQLLCKASSKEQGWMKSCKAMETGSGCVVQVTTQQGSNVAEALTFVPGVKTVDDVNGGRKLVPNYEGMLSSVETLKPINGAISNIRLWRVGRLTDDPETTIIPTESMLQKVESYLQNSVGEGCCKDDE